MPLDVLGCTRVTIVDEESLEMSAFSLSGGDADVCRDRKVLGILELPL
jgi:hypothetical protein